MAVAAPVDTRQSVRSRLSRIGWPSVCAFAVIAGLVTTSLAITASTRVIPQNDDWSFVKSALALATDGRFELYNWAQMFLLGQLVTAQPLLWIFGGRSASLELYGALAITVWLTCVYAVGRRCVGDRRALLVVCVIACWPGMGLITSSFMTDGPSAAASLVAISWGIAAISRQSRMLTVGFLWRVCSPSRFVSKPWSAWSRSRLARSSLAGSVDASGSSWPRAQPSSSVCVPSSSASDAR